MAPTDGPSWSTVVLEQQEHAYRLALQLTGDAGDAEDLTCDVFARLARDPAALAAGDGTGNRSTHTIRTSVTATTLQLWARRGRRPARARSGGGAAADHLGGVDVELRDALAGLPERYRLPVVLSNLPGVTYAEIAALLGIAPGSVAGRVRHGRALLRAALGLDTGTDTGTAEGGLPTVRVPQVSMR